MARDSENRVETPVFDDRQRDRGPRASAERGAEGRLQTRPGRVLDHRYRRYALLSLRTSRTPMALADVADDVVRREFGVDPTAVQDERERIYVELYHCHLPKLADSGLVSFDIDRKLASLREAGEEIPLDPLREKSE